ncbi:GMC family oxidoreductase N-terminal domain-containing protein [Fulvivirgaceae bacterium BMA12]|uniref:GMC family oxidoreductase N-terminal domain-containing protein n=1 Tax=Agaribacillus aureus TaxID=3051825 RepID=A0ABT8LFW4_9BACT|nr:GMC family oxidoreductase N-terminal domain-containing protein [Fulvivirgaceae bacterium BMA12]
MKPFDYIIVGAGSAGCVLANRLSQNPDNTVLLVEAGGPDKDPLIHIPGAYGKLFKKKYDWGFWTEPQPHVNNRSMYLPRGKTLGGSSSINAMAYVRGNKKDYDHWAKLGNKGWAYKDVLPYFIKSEHHEQYYLVDRGYHGKNGELNITFANKFITPFAKAFVEAGQELGLPYNPDYNGESQNGIGLFQFTIKNEKRHSSAAAFLKPALGRGNLTVMPHTQITRVLIENDRVGGVEYLRGKNKTGQLYARKEVILAAGSFKSPQILMLSGIGDPDELLKHQIQAIKHLPGVGKNLQDHLLCSVSALSFEEDGINHGIKPVNQLKNLLRYSFGKNGPLTTSILEAVAFMNLDDSRDSPNFQFQFSPMHPGKGYDYDLYDFKTFPVNDGFTIIPSLVNPKSRGFVTLKSANPLDSPLIQPNFLQHPEDLQTMVKGVKKALELINQNAFDAFRKEIICPPDTATDEAIIDHIKNSLETIYHPVGTCKMGKDEMAVVDSALHVHGIQGLRVVDASVMPTIITGNTNAPVIMIAEKASDMILNG